RDTLRLLPDGKCYHRRAMQKIRAQEIGWKAEVEKLQSYGAGPLDRAPRAWVDFWLPKITRPLHHPGNHRYAWALDRWARRALGETEPWGLSGSGGRTGRAEVRPTGFLLRTPVPLRMQVYSPSHPPNPSVTAVSCWVNAFTAASSADKDAGSVCPESAGACSG